MMKLFSLLLLLPLVGASMLRGARNLQSGVTLQSFIDTLGSVVADQPLGQDILERVLDFDFDEFATLFNNSVYEQIDDAAIASTDDESIRELVSDISTEFFDLLSNLTIQDLLDALGDDITKAPLEDALDSDLVIELDSVQALISPILEQVVSGIVNVTEQDVEAIQASAADQITDYFDTLASNSTSIVLEFTVRDLITEFSNTGGGGGGGSSTETDDTEDVDSEQVEETVDTEDVDTEQVDETVDTEEVEETADTEEIEETVDTEEVDTEEVDETVDSVEETVDTEDVEETVDTEEIEETVDTDEVEDTVDTEQVVNIQDIDVTQVLATPISEDLLATFFGQSRDQATATIVQVAQVQINSTITTLQSSGINSDNDNDDDTVAAIVSYLTSLDLASIVQDLSTNVSDTLTGLTLQELLDSATSGGDAASTLFDSESGELLDGFESSNINFGVDFIRLLSESIFEQVSTTVRQGITDAVGDNDEVSSALDELFSAEDLLDEITTQVASTVPEVTVQDFLVVVQQASNLTDIDSLSNISAVPAELVGALSGFTVDELVPLLENEYADLSLDEVILEGALGIGFSEIEDLVSPDLAALLDVITQDLYGNFTLRDKYPFVNVIQNPAVRTLNIAFVEGLQGQLADGSLIQRLQLQVTNVNDRCFGSLLVLTSLTEDETAPEDSELSTFVPRVLKFGERVPCPRPAVIESTDSVTESVTSVTDGATAGIAFGEADVGEFEPVEFGEVGALDSEEFSSITEADTTDAEIVEGTNSDEADDDGDGDDDGM